MKKKQMTSLVRFVLLALLAIIYLVPVVLMLLGSVKTVAEAMRFDLTLPTEFIWSNYSHVFIEGEVLRGYKNSIILTGLSTILTLLFGSFAGIYVGRAHGRATNVVYNYFILGITLSFQTATTFMLLQWLNIYGTYIGVILIFVGMRLPFTVMTFSSFVKNVPREIDEAGFIDGCTTTTLIFRILLPVLKPIFMTNLILTVIHCWNNFMVPLFYLGSAEKWPVPLMVYNFYGMYVQNWNYVFAMLVLTVLPVIIVYLFLQRYIVEGMTAGSVKG